MADFIQDDTIWRTTRSYEGKHDVLELQRGEYQGHPTYTLRELWVTPEGELRWAKTRPSKKGDCWSAMKLKSKELESLGKLLLAEARSHQPALERWVHPITPGGASSGPPEARYPSGQAKRQPTPREQKQLDSFDERPKFESDEDSPF